MTTVEDLQYTLDDVGNPLSLTTPSRTEVYGYDEMNQLESVCFQSSCPNATDPQLAFTYDKVGNRVTETRGDGSTSVTTTNCYATDGSDQLTTSITVGSCLGASATNTYDHNGNLTDDGSRTFSYDLENRVSSTTASSVTTTYGYDAFGKRISSSDGTTTHSYLWDTTHANAQLAIDSDGTTDRTYTYGHGRIATSDGTSDQYYLTDRIGSTMHLTDSTGNVDWRYTYEPFGAVRAATQVDVGATGTEMQFAGEQLDATGLVHLRARQYDPTMGRFIGVDPIELRNELIGVEDPYVSAYIYANNGPGSMTDPSGETAESVYDRIVENGTKAYETIRDYCLQDPLHIIECASAVALPAVHRFWKLARLARAAHAADKAADATTARRYLVDSTEAPPIGGSTAAEEAAFARGANGGLRPPTPGNISAGKFGKMIEWGEGATGPATAASRMATITRGELIRMGVTPRMAQLWARYFRWQAATGKGAPNATPRAELMERAYELLVGGGRPPIPPGGGMAL